MGLIEKLGDDPREVPRPHALAIFSSALLVAFATAIAHLSAGVVSVADLVMIYVAAIILVAATLGRWAAVFASALSVAAYDFFFVPPFYTFAISESRHLITFAM